MLSDRQRLPKLLLILTLMGLLGTWYGVNAEGLVVGYWHCLRDPRSFDGHPIRVSLQRVVELGENGYGITNVGPIIPVLGDAEGLRVGDVVSLVGHFDASRRVVVEEWREIHHMRVWKSLLGLSGILFLAVFLPRAFEVRNGRLVPRA
jgi:hypothetical protein